MIFRKYFVGGAILAMLGTSTPALAAGEPWKTSAPRGMTTQHQQYAAAARQVHVQVGAARFGYNPLQANWRYQGDRNTTLPMSNMTKSSLARAITGKYMVYREADKTEWSVRYYDPKGRTYFCDSDGRGGHREYSRDRYIHTTSFGLGGVMHWTPSEEGTAAPPPQEQVGWPTIANPTTGEITTYAFWKGDWYAEAGWLQEDYAAVWAKECPGLPKVGQINTQQSGQSLREFARGARGFRGFDVAFPNDPRDPLTAGMYYHLYPPTR